ncbi:hypothetical protein YPPY88_4562, partial [Yersinia pestis PY-88]
MTIIPINIFYQSIFY